MGPRRKKPRTGKDPEVSPTTEESRPITEDAHKQSADAPPVAPENGDIDAITTTDESKSPPAPSRSSWYGPWRSKASPVAQLAKESISVARGATSESSEAAARATARRPSSLSKSARGQSRKSVPLAAEATHVHATFGTSRPRQPSLEKPGSTPEIAVEDSVQASSTPLDGNKDDDARSNKSGTSTKSAKPQPGGWFGWWSRPDGYGSDGENSTKRQKLEETTLERPSESSSRPQPDTQVAPISAADSQSPTIPDTVDQQKDSEQSTVEAQPGTSWFGRWSTTQNQQAVKPQPSSENGSVTGKVPTTAAAEGSKNAADTPTQSKKDGEGSQPSSGWAFWSSDRPKDSSATPGGTERQVGELAVADTPSQSHPEAAQFNEQGGERKQPAKASASLLQRAIAKDASSTKPTLTSLTPASALSVGPTSTEQEDAKTRVTKSIEKGKASKTRPNLILPLFRDTLSPVPNPGYIERLTHYLALSLRLPGYRPDPVPQHTFIASRPSKVKRAVALGIHGFFPAPLIQKVLGQPTGTSIRFANYAASSIKTWCREHQPDVKDVEVEKVALEGEGFIADRVTTLWKLLLNWLDHLRQADFIFVACHSQGVPVALMLVAKLIQLGCLHPHVRIGICAMAGINLGPFPEYRSRLFGGSALELFDFGDSTSKVSKSYANALEICLRHGVRVTFVGSIDDQLVSLESSLHMPVSHPYIYRAVFVDGRLHAPSFLTHLVAFALRLRNLGTSDHGIIRELSGPLAGSLVGGEGHSRVYDDAAVYTLAIDFALESTDAAPVLQADPTTGGAEARTAASARRASLAAMPSTPAMANSIRRGSLSSSSTLLPGIAPIFAPWEPPPSVGNANPFQLPWAVRGLLEEDLVKQEMKSDVESLVQEFEQWKPTSKVLKDVRWRLEGVRSMQ